MMVPLVPRVESKRLGLARYFTGKPCKRGHVCERFTASCCCCECMKGVNEKWRLSNLDKVNATKRKWLAKNRELINGRNAKWRKDNPDKAKACDQNWRSRNRESLVIKQSRRRARMAGAAGTYTAFDIQEIFVSQKAKCGFCRTKLGSDRHIDHIVALSKGGTSDRRNLQILCKPCNLSKGAKDQIEFMQARGRLL